MTEGKLIVVNNKTVQVKFTNAKEKTVQFNVKESELSATLMEKKKNAIAQLHEVEVELEVIGGQPKQIREKGQSFQSHGMTTAPVKKNERSPSNQSSSHRTSSSESPGGDFHNPYNFVPALPRDGLQHLDKNSLGRELGDAKDTKDGKPAPHGVYCSDRWSGTIAVTLTTKTPLLIPDAAEAKELRDDNNKPTGHKIYDIRRGADGKPYLPPTSIKGMLRSAYEAVTNSRLSVFGKDHENRLAYRMSTSMGLEMVPARIEKDSDGKKIIRLFSGASEIGKNGKPEPNLMYAAWLPRYYNGNISRYAVKYPPYPNGNLPNHKDSVKAWIEKFQHWRWDKKKKKHIPDFQYWKVRSLTAIHDVLAMPNLSDDPGKKERRSYHQPLGEPLKEITGFVCITNPNIDRKHDERVFFETGHPRIMRLTKNVEQQWTELIKNYQNEHEDEICKKHQTRPPALNKSVWSRHIKGQGFILATDEQKLEPGTLCYARLNDDGDEVSGLYPVIISRELFKTSPHSLLPESLHPAVDIAELSPADRVFGWVNQKNRKPQEKTSNANAYKGQLRVHSVQCQTPGEQAIMPFNGFGLPLAILGEPKPAQTRFYTAENKNGTPIERGKEKEYGYQSTERGLRGRKVYPHQEYRRPSGEKERDSQNKSITGWVNPNTEFTFDIDVLNLSEVELGALLWLLSLPENAYHRLGGGKPLGFGSVHIDIDWKNSDLRNGESWKEFYDSLTQINRPTIHSEEIIATYRNAVESAYDSPFDQVPFIAAFCRCAKGFEDGLPVHYPRLNQEIDSDGKNYEWFTENEAGDGWSLPNLVTGDSLPLNPRPDGQSSNTNKALRR